MGGNFAEKGNVVWSCLIEEKIRIELFLHNEHIRIRLLLFEINIWFINVEINVELIEWNKNYY